MESQFSNISIIDAYYFSCTDTNLEFLDLLKTRKANKSILKTNENNVNLDFEFTSEKYKHTILKMNNYKSNIKLNFQIMENNPIFEDNQRNSFLKQNLNNHAKLYKEDNNTNPEINKLINKSNNIENKSLQNLNSTSKKSFKAEDDFENLDLEKLLESELEKEEKIRNNLKKKKTKISPKIKEEIEKQLKGKEININCNFKNQSTLDVYKQINIIGNIENTNEDNENTRVTRSRANAKNKANNLNEKNEEKKESKNEEKKKVTFKKNKGKVKNKSDSENEKNSDFEKELEEEKPAKKSTKNKKRKNDELDTFEDNQDNKQVINKKKISKSDFQEEEKTTKEKKTKKKRKAKTDKEENDKGNDSAGSKAETSGDEEKANSKPKKNKKEKNNNANKDTKNKNVVNSKKEQKEAEKLRIQKEIKDNPKDYVLDFMTKQNRPFSAQNIVDSLQGVLKKKEVEKILENLLNESKVIRKEYNQKIYLINQNNFPKIIDKDMIELDKKIENTNEILIKTVEKLTKLQIEYKNFGKDLSNEELEWQLESKKEKVDKLIKVLSKYEESGIDNVPVEKMNEAEKIYEKNYLNYKKIKSVTMNIIENLTESLEVNSKTFMFSLGFEVEDDYIKKLKMK